MPDAQTVCLDSQNGFDVHPTAFQRPITVQIRQHGSPNGAVGNRHTTATWSLFADPALPQIEEFARRKETLELVEDIGQ
jgi:hypothetical protein